jgi:hypothetical protein
MRNKFDEEQILIRERPAESARTAAPPRPQPAPRAIKHGLY